MRVRIRVRMRMRMRAKVRMMITVMMRMKISMSTSLKILQLTHYSLLIPPKSMECTCPPQISVIDFGGI